MVLSSLRKIVHSLPHATETDKRVVVLILGSAILVSLHRVVGSIDFGRSVLPSSLSSYSVLYMFAAAFVLFGLLPFVLLLVTRGSPADCGLQVGEWRTGLESIAIFFPIITVLFLVPASHDPEIRNFYPLDRSISGSLTDFVLFQSMRGLLYYGAWEFFFRGVMLFGLKDRLGSWAAIVIQTVPSGLWHIGFPTGELFTSILGGILFGLIALRTGSILWPFLLHFLIAVTLDLLILF